MASAPIAQSRVCTKCGAEKPLTAEHFVRKSAGFASRRKPCMRQDKRAAWAVNANAINAARRAARDDETRRAERERYRSNPGRKRRSVAAWRAANPEKRAEIDRKHYRKFRERKRKQAAEWAARNPDRKRENLRNWHRERRKASPAYRVRAALSAYLYFCLRGGKSGRRVEELLGYTVDDLRSHLERQFAKGMTWHNYGEWHIDHIIPVSSFDFRSADDSAVRQCWALANLRPLWAEDNIRKGNQRLHLL